MKILDEGFETQVRTRMGVDEFDLPDIEINSPFVAVLSEEQVIKQVPNYAEITDETELLFLKFAVISYICYTLCPSMPQRLNVEVQTVDTKWKKARTDWDKKAGDFYNDFLSALDNISSVEVVNETVTIFGVAPRYSDGSREPIGGEG